jgi:hypothetical protein
VCTWKEDELSVAQLRPNAEDGSVFTMASRVGWSAGPDRLQGRSPARALSELATLEAAEVTFGELQLSGRIEARRYARTSIRKSQGSRVARQAVKRPTEPTAVTEAVSWSTARWRSPRRLYAQLRSDRSVGRLTSEFS